MAGLGAKKVSRGSATVVVPKATPKTSYHVIACSDDLAATDETNERNNCRASRGKVSVRRPPISAATAPRLTETPAAFTQARSARFRFSAPSSASTLRCQLDGNRFADCRSPKRYAGPLSEGPHVFGVVARDRKGRDGPTALLGWVVDLTRPAAPTITSRPAPLTRATTATVGFAGAEQGLTFRCRLDGGSAEQCRSPYRRDGLSDGPHTLAVTAVDRAGNESRESAAAWRVDTTPPGAPRIDAHPESESGSTTARFSFSAGEAGASFRCRVDEAAFEPCSSPHEISGLAPGAHSFAVKATDAAGNEGEAASFAWRIDTVAPEAPAIGSRPEGLTRSREASFSFTAAEAGASFRCRLDSGEPIACESPHRVRDLPDGEHTFRVQAVDPAGNASQAAEASWRIDATPPPVPKIDAHPRSETRQRTARFAFSDEEGGVSLQCRLDGGAFGDCQSPRELADLVDGSHTFAVRARDAIGNESEPASFSWTVDPEAPLAIDPPPVDATVATSVADSTDFLYRGDDPVQTGVAPGTIEERRAGVIRGRALARSGEPLSNVRVTVLDHPELGQTETRGDGGFDLAANGGGPLTVEYRKPGFLPVQRQVELPWNDFAVVDDVVLLPQDDEVTRIEPGASGEVEVARGSQVSDGDGERQSTLMFEPGTEAEMVLPGGERRPLAAMNVRATEYTVGADGPEAMPGELPPTSGYTYAAELSIDEAQAAGASDVRFSKPVVNYVENFLDFPVGTPVPTGYYDRADGKWKAAPDGLVVKIVAERDGRAELDVDGDGNADDAAKLGPIGIDDAELERLAALYEVDQSLWRVPVTHFTPWDYNWAFGPPEGAEPPGELDPTEDAKPPGELDPKASDEPDCQSEQAGSIIGCEGQTLGESLAITGSPMRLHYKSTRVPGHAANRSLDIPLTRSSVPPGLKSVELVVSVGGRRFVQSFSAAPNQTHTFAWDGKDAYGRAMQGEQPVSVDVGYTYAGVYREVNPCRNCGIIASVLRSFGYNGNGTRITGSQTRQEVTLWKDWRGKVGAWDARAQGLGGWSLDAHHAYDPQSRTLHRGDGSRRRAEEVGNVIEAFAGTGVGGNSGDGGAATEAEFQGSRGTAAGPDGSVYIADGANGRVRRVKPDGTIETVAGAAGANGTYPLHGEGEAKPANGVNLDDPRSVALGPDNSVYVTAHNNYVFRIDAPGGAIVDKDNGRLARIAGKFGGQGFSGDGGPALQAQLADVHGVAAAPDGSVYVADSANRRIRRIGPDGIINTVAGGGDIEDDRLRDGRAATQIRLAGYPTAVTVGPRGEFFVAANGRLLRVGTDGIVKRVAGGGCAAVCPPEDPRSLSGVGEFNSIEAGPDGSLYIAADGGVYLVSPEGLLSKFAGQPTESVARHGDGGPARRALVRVPTGLSLGPDGSLYIAEGRDGLRGALNRVRRVTTPFPGVGAGGHAIPSQDGSEVYAFDRSGRHLRTLDALTASVRYRFSYDVSGRLEKVEDGDGNATKVERDAQGKPEAIVAPGGQRTDLAIDADGYLSRVANPADEANRLTYGEGGLLATRTDPNGGVHRYSYDETGRLTKDEDPAEGSKSLSRTETANGHKVVVRTALGRASTYELERLPSGDTRRAVTDRSGARTETLIGTNGMASMTAPDGRQLSQELGPDPRFGMRAPVVVRQTERMPSGLTKTTTGERLAPQDGTGAGELVEKLSVNGRVSTQSYNPGARTLTSTSPTGLKRVLTLDERGRVVKDEPAEGIEPVVYGYDGRGRVISARQGEQSQSYAHDGQDRLISVTDAGGGAVRYGYDRADRVTEVKLPTGRTYGFEYDRNGNRTAVTMPGGGAHRLDYTAVDLERGYTPPGADPGQTRRYDRDRKLTKTTLPAGRVVDLDYDSGGRQQETSYDEATVAATYVGETDLLKSLTRTAKGGDPKQETAFSYDGRLLTSLASTGPGAGRFDYRYDNNLSRIGAKLTSGADVVDTPFERDADGRLAKTGPFTIQRGGPAGAPTKVGDGTLEVATGHDSFGRAVERAHSVAGDEHYRLELTNDNRGRIVKKQETLAGQAHAYDYTYDADGQLTRVDRDGQPVERYAYDTNGNRTSRQNGNAPPESAAYDGQDRLTRLGSVAYELDADGFLARRGSDTFRYSAQGELLEAKVAGRTVTYGYDGRRRRVSRTDDSGTTQYLYGNPSDPFQLTAARSPSGQLSTFYYDDDGLLFAIQRGSSRFYVATDQVGTPRAVTDSQGNVAKTFEYDSFGRKLAETGDPQFDLPIGFAGGLADEVTGLVRFGYRDYDVDAGRWTARDPILYDGGFANLYGYVGNHPVTARDPDGLEDLPVYKEELPAPIEIPKKPADKLPKPREEYKEIQDEFAGKKSQKKVQDFSTFVKGLWEKCATAVSGGDDKKDAPRPRRTPPSPPPDYNY